jgi:excisionase family DNA binding protein
MPWHQHAMTVLSLSEAAAATGLNKTTVLRSMKSGKISGTRDPLGQWRIDAAELHRVYPLADATAAKTHSEVLNSLMRMARQRLRARKTDGARWRLDASAGVSHHAASGQRAGVGIALSAGNI